MTLPRLAAMSRQWAHTPPLNESLAALLRALGWKPAPIAPADQRSDAAFRKVVEEEEFE